MTATKPKRVRILHDECAFDPRKDMDLCCKIQLRWPSWPGREGAIAALIRDTQTWRVVERIVSAANPDWTGDDLPDLSDHNVRQQWIDALAEKEIKFHEFDTSHRSTYLAHTTPDMCEKLGIKWEHAQAAMQGECEMFEQWCEGDVYGFIVEELEHACMAECNTECARTCSAASWTELDSCWGFYGTGWFENGMSEHVPDELHEQLRSAEVEYSR